MQTLPSKLVYAQAVNNVENTPCAYCGCFPELLLVGDVDDNGNCLIDYYATCTCGQSSPKEDTPLLAAETWRRMQIAYSSYVAGEDEDDF